MDDENGADCVCAIPEEMSDVIVASQDLNNQVEIRQSTRDRRPRQTFMYETLGQPTLQPHTAVNTVGFYGPPVIHHGYTSYYPTQTPTYLPSYYIPPGEPFMPCQSFTPFTYPVCVY